MDNITQDEVEKLLIKATEDRKNFEKDLISYQSQIKKIQEDFELTLSSLKSAQTKENQLQEQLYEIQKANIKQTLSLNSVKKVFGEATPFFLNIKERALGAVQNVKGYIDGTHFDRKWIDEKYESYKEICISKGQDIKSKDEFQKIALSIKDVSNESSDLNLYDILGKVSKELGSAKDSIKDVWQSLGLVEKINSAISTVKESDFDSPPLTYLENHESDNKGKNIEVSVIADNAEPMVKETNILDKKSVFNEWIVNRNIRKTKSKTDISVLYKDYDSYVEFVYPLSKTELIYTIKSGSFTNALNKAFENLSQETVKVEGKTVKKFGLKAK
jgi:hypothetical protein